MADSAARAAQRRMKRGAVSCMGAGQLVWRSEVMSQAAQAARAVAGARRTSHRVGSKHSCTLKQAGACV